MANLVISGVYASTSALPTGDSAPANGTSYLVGTKCPYDVYTYQTSGTKYVKGVQVGRKTDFSISIDDVTESIPIAKLYTTVFTGANGKNLKVRKGLRLGEIHLYVPAAD